MIGGRGTIVEIDESVFYKTKYNRGRWRRHTWVFGMIERNTRNVIMIPVIRRDIVTLIPLIIRYIRPGFPYIYWIFLTHCKLFIQVPQ